MSTSILLHTGHRPRVSRVSLLAHMTFSPSRVLLLAACVAAIGCIFAYQRLDLSVRFPSGSSFAAAFFSRTPIVDVSQDSTSPTYAIIPAGSTDVPIGVIRMTASGDSVLLQALQLRLSQGSSNDVVKASIYAANGLKVGEAYFVGAGTTASTTLMSAITLPRGTSTLLTVKADLSLIGNGQLVRESGHLIAIDYASAAGLGTVTKKPATFSGGTSVPGVRMMKTIPAVSIEPLPSSGVQDGKLMRFKVSADGHGPVGLTQMFLIISPISFNAGGGVRNVNVYGYTDGSYSMPISGVSPTGALRSTDTCIAGCTSNDVLSIGITTASGVPAAIQIPAGATRYFEVRGSVTGYQNGSSVTTKLVGDSMYGQMVPATSLVGKDAYFIWSPNSTTTAVRSDQDWSTGFAVPGLPPEGLIYTRNAVVVTPPAQTVPTCTLSASEATIIQPRVANTRLAWTSSNATSLTIDNGVGSVTPVSAGSKSVAVSRTTTFTATASGSGGTTTCSALVEVLFTPTPRLITPVDTQVQ